MKNTQTSHLTLDAEKEFDELSRVFIFLSCKEVRLHGGFSCVYNINITLKLTLL